MLSIVSRIVPPFCMSRVGMSDTQRTERRCRASRLFARLTEMIAQGRRGEWSLSPTGLE